MAAGSPGYPKKADSIGPGKKIRHNARVVKTVRGTYRGGAYVWLDATPGGRATEEINVASWYNSLTRPRDVMVGVYRNDNGDRYRVYRNSSNHPDGYRRWYVVRQSRTYSLNMNMTRMLKWMRARGLPNSHVINVLPMLEANRGSGQIRWNGMRVPNL